MSTDASAVRPTSSHDVVGFADIAYVYDNNNATYTTVTGTTEGSFHVGGFTVPSGQSLMDRVIAVKAYIQTAKCSVADHAATVTLGVISGGSSIGSAATQLHTAGASIDSGLITLDGSLSMAAFFSDVQVSASTTKVISTTVSLNEIYIIVTYEAYGATHYAHSVVAGGDWTNPTYAYVSDNIYATAAPSAGVDKVTTWNTFHAYTHSTATVTQVVTTVEAKSSVAGNGKLKIELMNDAAVLGTATTTALTGSDANYTLTVTTGLTPAILNDQLKFKVRVTGLYYNGAATLSIDSIKVDVTRTQPLAASIASAYTTTSHLCMNPLSLGGISLTSTYNLGVIFSLVTHTLKWAQRTTTAAVRRVRARVTRGV